MRRTPLDLVLPLALVALYIVGMLAPRGPFWGVHASAYLPVPVQVLLVVVSLSILLLVLFRRDLEPSAQSWLEQLSRGRSWYVLAAVVALGAGILFGIFPIQSVAYGDARGMATWHGDNEKFQLAWITNVFRPQLLQQKEALTIGVHRTLSYLLNMDIVSTYRMVSTIVGALFIGMWLVFLRQGHGLKKGLLPLFACGLFLGANQLFFGHIENYAFAFFCGAVFFVLAYLFLDGRVGIFLVLLSFLVAFRAHGVFITLVPAVMVLVLWSLRNRFGFAGTLLKWRWLGTIALVLLAGGAAAYVFGFESYRWQGFPVPDREGTFLPVLTPDAPYRNYTVQSLGHVVDLLNILALVAAPACFMLLGLVVFSGKRVNWGSIRVKFGLSALLFMTGFYVLVHPLLTMPRDWDLFSLIALPVLFLTAILAAEGRYTAEERRRWTVVVVLSGLFALPIFAVNASTPLLSRRLEDLGEHAYRTSYKGSSVLIQMGQKLEPDLVKRTARRDETLRRLQPRAGAWDPEYGFLMAGGGGLHLLTGDTTAAERLWRESLQYDPDRASARNNLIRLYLLRRRPDLAAEHVEYLIRENPDDVAALEQGLRIALSLGDAQRFETWMRTLKRLAPDDPEIEQLEGMARRAWPSGP